MYHANIPCLGDKIASGDATGLRQAACCVRGIGVRLEGPKTSVPLTVLVASSSTNEEEEKQPTLVSLAQQA